MAARIFHSYDKIAYRLLGNYTRHHKADYFDLELDLKKANVTTPLDIYAARMLFMSMLAGLAAAILVAAVIAKAVIDSGTGTLFNVPEQLVGNPLGTVIGNTVFMAFLIVLAVFVGVFVVSYLIYTLFPQLKAKSRESEINMYLPYAVTFMYAMSKGGMSLVDVFRAMKEHQDIYGEVAVEVGTVVRGVDLLGLDVITAIKRTAATTPSDQLKNFFESLASLMEGGSDLATFMHTRSQMYRTLAAQEQKSLLELLSLFAEIYVTAFVAGPLFLIVILVVIGMMSTSNAGQLELIIYIFMPLGSIMFLWLLSVIGLSSEHTKSFTTTRILNEFHDVNRMVRAPKENIIERAQLRFGIKKFLENPLGELIQRPYLVLLVSVPAALITLIVALASRIDLSMFTSPGELLRHIHLGVPSVSTIASVDNLLVLVFFIAVLPFTIFWELRMYKIRKIDSTVPEFLKRLAGVNESGLTLAQAVKSLVRSNLGVLNVEVKKMVADMEWGADIKDALVRFEYRVRTPSISRTVTLITEASESSGDIKETLEIAGADAGSTQTLQEERSTNMLLYVLIIYISFFVFLYIIYTLVSVFVPVLPNVPASSSTQSMSSMGIAFNGVDTKLLTTLFYHSVLIEGLFSGIIAGMMGSGNLFSGLKHALIMILIGFLVFAIFI